MIDQNQQKLLLQLFPVLTTLSDADQKSIFQTGQIISLPRGQMLLQPNQQCQYVPLVITGQLRVYRLSENGREMTLFRTGPGETCLMSVACRIKNEEFPAQAQVEDPATLFMLPLPVYHNVLDRSSAWKDFLIVTLYDRLAETMETLEAVAFDRTDRRLASWLLGQTGGSKGEIRTTHETIAVELGTVREVISRLLGEFRNKQVLTLGRGRIEILEPDFLQDMLDH